MWAVEIFFCGRWQRLRPAFRSAAEARAAMDHWIDYSESLYTALLHVVQVDAEGVGEDGSCQGGS